MPGIDYIESDETRAEIKALRNELAELESKVSIISAGQNVTLQFADSGLEVHFSVATPSPPSVNTMGLWIYTGALLPSGARSFSWYSHNTLTWVEVGRDS